MEAKTDVHTTQLIRHLGGVSLSLITMYNRVLFASQTTTSAVLGCTRRYLIRSA